MIGAPGTTDFDAGNAALRARRSRLLSSERLLGLAGAGADEILGALADTDWAPDIEAALTRYSGPRVLQEAARTRVARQIRRVCALFGGEARDALDLRTARYDLDNIVTVIRGQARGVDPDRILPMLVPAGRVSDAVLAELLREPGLRATLDRLVVLGVPTPAVAMDMLGAWQGPTASPMHLERAARLAWARGVQRALAAGLGGPLLARDQADRIDQDNVLAVLRLWTRLTPTERGRLPLDEHLLPGGRVPLDVLRHGWTRRDRDDVAAALGGGVRGTWAEALRRWAGSDDLGALVDVLDELRARWSLRLFVRGDPLSLAIPLAFITAVEVEVRNVRVLAQGAGVRLPVDVIRSRLWVQEGAWAA